MDNSSHLKKASWWRKSEQTVICELCPHRCKISENRYGLCHARHVKNGVLYSLVYGKPVAVHIDPIEKKPLYHFYPGSDILSIGTIGCNLFCTFCQNWDIARAKPEDIPARYVSPEEIESTVQQSDVIGVAFTYNEPTIFGEYVVDISRLVKSRGYKTIMVSNGFITPEAVKDIYPLIDAANIDLKAFSNDFYRKECKGQLTPVLDALVEIKKQGTFLEITTLVIPGLNNMEHDVVRMTRWIVENLGKETPYHISAFYPSYQMKHIHRTTKSELDFVKNIADSNGLQYVYEGNIMTTTESNTYCPSCGKLLIERRGYRTVNNLEKNQCSCGREIPVEL